MWNIHTYFDAFVTENEYIAHFPRNACSNKWMAFPCTSFWLCEYLCELCTMWLQPEVYSKYMACWRKISKVRARNKLLEKLKNVVEMLRTNDCYFFFCFSFNNKWTEFYSVYLVNFPFIFGILFMFWIYFHVLFVMFFLFHFFIWAPSLFKSWLDWLNNLLCLSSYLVHLFSLSLFL